MDRRKFAQAIAAVIATAAAKPVMGAPTPPLTPRPVAKSVHRHPVPVRK